jgi:hypothetical protein
MNGPINFEKTGRAGPGRYFRFSQRAGPGLFNNGPGRQKTGPVAALPHPLNKISKAATENLVFVQIRQKN